MRVTDRKNWEELWREDKESIIYTMRRNVASDIENGYNLLSMSIQKQILDIVNYEREYEKQLDNFSYMKVEDINKWCYYDLKKRGAIGQ